MENNVYIDTDPPSVYLYVKDSNNPNVCYHTVTPGANLEIYPVKLHHKILSWVRGLFRRKNKTSVFTESDGIVCI